MSCQIKDIVENNLCTGCGICISESSSSKMIWNDYGFIVPKLDNSFNEKAIKVCPFNLSPDEDVQNEDKLADIFLKDSQHINDKIGRFENTYVGYANQFRENSSSGGIATYVFEQLLKQQIVQHLFVVKEINGTYQYLWFNNSEQIKQISKTRYIPVTLEKLFKEVDSKEGKVAVSGVACFVKAIRLKQHYNSQYKEKIPFIIGIICGGLKSRFFTDYLVQKVGIEGEYKKQDYRIKDAKSTASDYSFGAFNTKEEFRQIKMRTVGDMWGSGMFKSNACDFCDDVTTELADVSLGDAWLNPYTKDGLGTSVIITRTKIADQLIKEGINNQLLTVDELSTEMLELSQAGSFKHRHLGLKYRIAQMKKQSKLFPNNRKRFLKNIPFEFKIVQYYRMKIRKQSLILWKKSQSITEFEHDMSSKKQKLFKLTSVYHRIQKLRGLLGLKTI